MRRIDVFAVTAMLLISGIIVMISDDSEAGLIDESALATHDPILIVGNEEFTSENGVVDGSGTELDPYLIENWTFDQWDGRGILIEDTTSHVVIRNCEMFNNKGTWPCIELTNTSNIDIENCLFNRTDISVAIRSDCSNITIKDTFFNDSRRGVDVKGSNEITIRNNTFIRNYKPINFEVGVENATIKWNTFIGNGYMAVVIENSNDLSIEENLFLKETDEYPFISEDDYYYGTSVILSDTFDIIIKSNNFSNVGEGLITEDCERIYIEDNEFHHPIRNDYYDDFRIGLHLMNTRWSRLSGNNYYNCGFVIWGEEKQDCLTNEISSNNLIDGDPTMLITNTTQFPEIEDDLGQIIFINCSDMNISGLSMRTSGVAVCVAFCENISFTYNGIEDTGLGVFISGGKNIEFENNNFLHCNIGTSAMLVSNFSAKDCNYNRCLIGMNLLADNSTIDDNSFVIVNQSIDLRGSYNRVLENYIGFGENGIYLHGSRNSIFNNSVRYLSASGIRIDDDPWIDHDHRVPLHLNNVQNNSIRNCRIGLSIPGTGNFILNNTISNGTDGIEIHGAHNQVLSNRIFENNGTGILIEEFNNEIRNNTINDNLDGIILSDDEAQDNYIVDNLIFRNEYYGIRIREKAHRNYIIRNNFSENREYGIKIFSGCILNVIHRNEFRNNNGSDIQAHDDGNNQWDDGVGKGNFWSDYERIYVPPAVNNGEVWNISYMIAGSSGAKDRYPLVGEYSEPVRELMITTENLLEAYASVEYSVAYEVYIHSIDIGDLVWTLSTNASWLSFNGSWYLTGTPQTDDAGSYWVNISVCASNITDFTNFTLTVQSSYVSPTIIGVDLTTINEDTYYSTDYDHAGDGTPTWHLSTDCDFLSITTNTGILSGTPDNDDVGTYWVNVSLYDGESLSDFRNFTLNVININDPPDPVNFNVDRFEFDEDSDQIITIDATDQDSDDLNITWTIEGIGVLGYGESVSLDLEPGNYTLVVRVTDGNGSWTESNITIIVEEDEKVEHDEEYKWVALLIVVFVLLFLFGVFIFIRKNRSRNEKSLENNIVSRRGPPKMVKKYGLEPSMEFSDELTEDMLLSGMMDAPSLEDDVFEFDEPDLTMIRMEVMDRMGEERVSMDELHEGLKEKMAQGRISEDDYEVIMEKLRPGAFQPEE